MDQINENRKAAKRTAIILGVIAFAIFIGFMVLTKING